MGQILHGSARTTEAAPSESKLKQAAEALGDGVIGQVFEGVIDGAAKIMSGAVDAISGAGELAADCGSVAVEAAC